MKKLLLLLVPLLFLVGCESEEPAPSYDRIKYVEVNCEGAPTDGNFHGLKGERALQYCPVAYGRFALTIETSSGSIYQIEVPASDLSDDRGQKIGTLTNLPKVGDIWR